MTDPPHVGVRAMSTTEFEAWHEQAIVGYAQDVAAASGRPLEEALQRSRTLFGELLPNGADTDGTWLLKVVDDTGIDIGVLWIGPHSDRVGVAYIYDIAIDAAYRGRGFGRAAMLAAESVVAEAGVAEIGLNVFGFNEPARRLYDSLGYRVVATQMVKSLG